MGNGHVQHQFFESRKQIEFVEKIQGHGGKVSEHVNIEPVLGLIISKRYATLHELRTIYDYEDALNMWECIAVESINETIAHERAERESKR